MSDIKRRDFLKATAGVAAGTALGSGSALFAPAAEAQLKITPEKGAKLRVLRWKRFVQGDEDVWAENTKKFTQLTGIEVRIDAEGWEDVRPKAAVAANVGSGPDIIISTMEDAHMYPEKLVDVSDLANYLGIKYGGWYDSAKAYGMHDKKWVAIMMGAAGNALVYRASHVKAAGFDTVPKDMAGFLKLCQALKAKGTPAGFALGNATGDSSWTHWLVWAHGGKLVDAKNNVVINSSETIAALEYSKQLYETFIPGTLSWLDPNNNKAFLDGQLSLTANGISVYYAAKTSKDEKLIEMTKDIEHAYFPVGLDGKARELNLVFPMMIFKYSKFPNAAKAYLQFMMEKEQYVPWQEAAIGYVCHPLAAYEKSAFWTDDPKKTPYRDCMKNMTPNGYAGTLGYASAACVADFIIPNMVAEAASGSKTPKEAAERAQKRAERYYKV
jgi:multiple sugar transport system substrate-binding protein